MQRDVNGVVLVPIQSADKIMKVIEILLETTEYEIFVDLDGVLADFTKGISRLWGEAFNEKTCDMNKRCLQRMWDSIHVYTKEGGEIWYELELMPDARELWDYIKKHNPQVLSATGHTVKEHTADQKRRWVAKHFGKHVKVNLTQTAQQKSQYALPGRILIDDKTKAINPWEAAGGVGILHTSAANTISELKSLGI